MRSKVKSSNCIFFPAYTPKPKDSLFTVLNDKEKEQILKRPRTIPQSWEQQTCDIFAPKNYESIIK